MLERSPNSNSEPPAARPRGANTAALLFEASPAIRDVISRIGRTEDIVFSPDDRRLAVADYLAEKIFLFSIRIGRNPPAVTLLDAYAVLSSRSMAAPHGMVFLGNEHMLVCNRYGGLAVHRLPAAGAPAGEAEVLASVRGMGVFAKVSKPGSGAAYEIAKDCYRVLVCNNDWHAITAHTVTLGDKVRIRNEGILIEHGLTIPDGVAVSPDHRWIAVSNHVEGAVRVFGNTPALNRSTPASAVLRGLVSPHGLRFSPDGRRLFVADAASPYVSVFESASGTWQGTRDAATAIRVVDEEIFYSLKHDAREGGAKGLALDSRGEILATTFRYGAINLWDVDLALANPATVDPAEMAEMCRLRDDSMAQEGPIERRWTVAHWLRQFPVRAVRRGLREAKAAGLRAEIARLRRRNRALGDSILDPAGPMLSLTTHGFRLHQAYLAIESIARGELKPSRLVLSLGREDFEQCPESLRRLEARGLEVHVSEDFGPHTKYYPLVEREAGFDRPLVTADDDILYPPDWLRRLVAAHRAEPTAIHCYRVQRIRFACERLVPYGQWQLGRSAAPSHLNFINGVSGAIYPPAFLTWLKERGTAFRELCPDNDDVWLSVNALRAGIRVAQVADVSVHFAVIPGSQRERLSKRNLDGGGTQRELSATLSASDISRLRMLAQQAVE